MKNRYPCEAHPLYSRWLSMTQRCTNPRHKQYFNWGGRGIIIADDLKSFKNYSKYAESLKGYSLKKLSKLTLDRKENNGNYEKGNLRWVDHSTQIANQGTNSRGFNQYTGINWSKSHNRWVARLTYRSKCYLSSVHITEELALAARNTCIKVNDFPHPVQTFYK